MSVFFDHQVKLPYSGHVTEIQWHKTHGLLAIACISQTNGATVTICEAEGDPLPDAVIRRTRMATTLQWHPFKKVLATGWETGEVIIRSEQEKETFEATRIHKAEITIMHWTSNGMRLLTGDASGLLVMWKSETRGCLHQMPLYQKSVGEALTQIVITPPPVMEAANDLLSLARAAVSGDEKALDMFTWQKGKTDPKLSAAAMGVVEANTFFVASKNGTVYYVGDSDKLIHKFSADGPIKKLLYYDDKDILVTITSALMLILHSVSGGGDAKEILKVKMNGKAENVDMNWAGKGVLATCTGERFIRMWDLEQDENYVLDAGNEIMDPSETIICCAFSPGEGILAGGTGSGKIAFWKYCPQQLHNGKKEEPENFWQLQTPASISGPVSDLAFGSSRCLLAVNTIENVFILNEQKPSICCTQGTAAVQTGTMQLSVDIFSSGMHFDLKTDIQVKGVCTTKNALAICDGKQVVVYEVSESSSTFCVAGSFHSASQHMCIYEQNIYTLEPGKIQVRNFQGIVKQLLPLTDAEDVITSMTVCTHFLVVATEMGAVKVFDLSRREAKHHAGPKYLRSSIMEFGGIISAKCNANGSKISVIVSKFNNMPDSNIYIWDTETDTIQFFNFATGRDEADDFVAGADGDAGSTLAEKGKCQSAKDVAGRHPISHFWDWEEPRLFVCEAKILEIDQKVPSSSASKSVSLSPILDDAEDVMIISLFCTSDNGILIQDSFSCPICCESLLALEIPCYFFKKKVDYTKNDSHTLESNFQLFQPQISPASMVLRRLHRDFVGLENADKAARDAMMNFSFYLTMGDMDEAFKAIKVIKSESVWENMAKMCVKTRRLDVARVCLGHMGHARGAKMLREVAKEPELDAQIAVLAINLGLHEDAERLLKNCHRYDILSEYYQSHGDWEKALSIAEKYDRIHLRTTCYNYAKHLESQGDYMEAIKYYEKSGTQGFEVPRMLFDDLIAFENYVNKSKDRALQRWWAQFQESTGEMEAAMKYYNTAQDFLSLVRIYCFMNDVDKAVEVCSQTGDRAACYHVARQFENNDQLQEAINFFTRAQAYGNAIRLCKDHGYDDKLLNMALLGKPDDMVEAARYYEVKPGHQDKAVMLYHKAGYFSKALELAFSSKEYSALQMVSESLDDSADPHLLQRCADFFNENSQFDRAVDLLAAAKRYWDALKICMEQHVPMTEELVEKLTPSKEMEESDAIGRNKILEGIGEVCMAQRQYHLATKKFTQAGNRVKAMKALLKSGDTEKIVFFASVSRQREIYIMAAHYLQTLDWQKDPEIMKNIITFYTKGRAPEPLSGFYDACAQLEIDEFQNYEKALGAMGEAYKCLSRINPEEQNQEELKLGDLKNRMTLVNRFIKAKSLYSQNSEEAVRQCQALLNEPGYERAVRSGDIFGFLAEHFAKCEKWKMAYNCIEEIRGSHNANLSYYVSPKTIEAVYKALNLPVKDTFKIKNNLENNTNDEFEGEILDEDVIADD